MCVTPASLQEMLGLRPQAMLEKLDRRK